ncbi:hypothetical protein [Holophaga foetida]|uniref:hypothetical protein n=1 Tax=Holophaga foetida TaxID=35839 RepID=UPI0002474A0C|nr:hypothetical protein [Holophaga foetida]
MTVEFCPMRSLIYVGLSKEKYRHLLQNWLYRIHIPDSISQFGPYVTKYAFYNALPVPPEGERFGTIKMQLTEHYWQCNPFQQAVAVKTFKEVFPIDVLRWQGNMPDESDGAVELEGDEARSAKGGQGAKPFIFAFVPLWWEEDIKGKMRTIADGPNYRWQFVMKYPEGVSQEQGDKWFLEEVAPAFAAMPEVNRILSSKIIQNVNGCSFNRVVEMWFDGPDEWYAAAVTKAAALPKPTWAKQDKFPFLASDYEFASVFLTDYATSDNLSQYRGYITLR